MRWLCLIVIAGCSFEPPPAITSPDAAAPSGDAPPGQPPPPPPGDAPPPPDAPPARTCTTSDGALEVCLELDDAFGTGIALDGSGHLRDATLANVGTATRDVPTVSQAAGISISTTIRLAETSALDMQTSTLVAWVQRSSLPNSGGRFGVVDIGRRQAAMGIDDTGHVVCFVKTDDTIWVRSGGSTRLNEWALAACTYDPPMLCAYSFRNGSSSPEVTCGNTDGASLDTSSTSGTAVGALFDVDTGSLQSHLKGNVDGVRIYSRALSQDELCNSGNIPGC